MDFKTQFMWIIAGLGLVALVGVFKRMRGGFHTENVLVFCATLALVFGGLIAIKERPFAFIGAALAGIVAGGVVGYFIGRERKGVALSAEDLKSTSDDLKKLLDRLQGYTSPP